MSSARCPSPLLTVPVLHWLLFASCSQLSPAYASCPSPLLTCPCPSLAVLTAVHSCHHRKLSLSSASCCSLAVLCQLFTASCLPLAVPVLQITSTVFLGFGFPAASSQTLRCFCSVAGLGRWTKTSPHAGLLPVRCKPRLCFAGRHQPCLMNKAPFLLKAIKKKENKPSCLPVWTPFSAPCWSDCCVPLCSSPSTHHHHASAPPENGPHLSSHASREHRLRRSSSS